MALSLGFATFYLVVGNNLWNKKNLKIPAGLLITLAVSLTPLFLYGFQKYIGVWSQSSKINYHDYYFLMNKQLIYLELGTIFTTLLALRFYKFAFLTFPLAISFWCLSIDITLFIFYKYEYSFEEKSIVSCIFGIICLAISYCVDKKYKEDDFAFWGYLFGLITFYVGIFCLHKNEIGKFLLFILGLLMIILSVYLRRRVFAIFGIISIIIYLGYLSYDIFKDSFMFSISLAIIGSSIITLGIKYQKNKKNIESLAESLFPRFLLKWRPEERG